MIGLGKDAASPDADRPVDGSLQAPVLPLTTYLLARRLTGRPNVAILAAVLTAFGGGFDLSPDRLWVNSLFPSGQEAYPLYPRDLVFGLLPLAIWAFIRALDEPGRWLRWSLFSGAILGICGLIQVQLLLPIPLVLGVPAVALAWRQPAHRRTVLASLAVAGLVALGFVAPWIVEVAGQIGSNGGVALDSADSLQPARFGFWSYPVQFGLLLPLIGFNTVQNIRNGGRAGPDASRRVVRSPDRLFLLAKEPGAFPGPARVRLIPSA